MKLKTKFTLLVASCVFLLLGSFYFISVRSADSAIVNFNEQSAVIFNTSLLDDDGVETELSKMRSSLPVEAMFDNLSQSFSDQSFILTQNSQLRLHNLAADIGVEMKAVSAGFQFLIKQPDVATSVVQITSPQLNLQWQGMSYDLFWFPTITLQRQEQQTQLREQINNSFLLNLALLSAVAVVLSWIGASYFLRPLNKLKESFVSIKQGKLDTRQEIWQQDEVGELIQGFNQLAAWLQGLHQQYEQMNSDLSHELRTPINAMQSRLEAMEDGLLELSKEQVGILLDELAQMKRLIDDLSLLSLTESSSLTLNMQRVNVSELMCGVLSRYDLMAAKLGIELVGEIAKDIEWRLDESRLRQVLINLLDNAFKYGADGQYICVSLQSSDNQLLLRVIDRGQGMTEQQQADAFKRFYRVHPDRNKEGLGLGLPICQHLVALMAGTMTLTSAPGQGCTFTLIFSSSS